MVYTCALLGGLLLEPARYRREAALSGLAGLLVSAFGQAPAIHQLTPMAYLLRSPYLKRHQPSLVAF
jgi:hypothetical protein